jgi:hypothetical protein
MSANGSTSSSAPGTATYDPNKQDSQYGTNTSQPSKNATSQPSNNGGGAQSTVQ